MREFERKRKLRSRLYSTPALVLLALLTVLFIKGTVGVLFKARQSSGDAAALQAKIVALSGQETDLRKEIKDLQTSEGVDEALKQKFNVSSSDEHVAIIVDQDPSGAGEASSSQPWYKRFWSAIMP